MSGVVIETTSKQVMKNKSKRGFWKPEEDLILRNYVETHGEGNWPSVSKKSGLMRGGKSCRLRWKNYLRPNIKRGSMSEEEEDLIIRMHKLLGNRWSLIAGRLPGRTDNEVKNYWNTHLNKRSLRGKRKTTDCIYHSNNDKEDRKSSTVTKRSHLLCNSLHSIGSANNMAPNDTTEGHNDEDNGRKEDNAVTALSTDHRVWVEDLMCYSYGDVGSSLPQEHMPPTYAAFLFDDDPFMPYFDSFLLFGALGLSVDANYINPT